MTNKTAVTLSKQWIHFFLSDLWPPTSNMWKVKRRKEKAIFTMPVVITRVLKMSWSVGLQEKRFYVE